MNSVERIKSVLDGSKPDRVPVMLHNFLMAAKESNVTMSKYRSCPETIARVHLEAVEKYGYDGIVIDVDTCTLAGAVGVPVDFPEDEPARTNGSKLKELKQVFDLELPDLSKDSRVNIWVDACKVAVRKSKGRIFVRGNCDQAPFSLASMIRGSQDWLMDIFDPSNDEMAFKLLDYSTEVVMKFIDLIADTGVDMVSNGDSLAVPDLISPEMYRKFAMPYEKKIAAYSKTKGLPYLLHICGNVNAILDDMISVGADVLELDYKTDINLIYNKCSDKMVFCGNIDPTGILAHGTIVDVRRKVDQLLELYSDSPRFILNAGCAIPSSTPPENLFEMIKCVNNLQSKSFL
jgi:MtaA/CmuA family methyltransferase